MSDRPGENHIPLRHQVTASLAQLIGLPLTAARRAADMRTLQFGALRSIESGSVGDFALHVSCPWRIEGPGGIVTGSRDLWLPVDETEPFEEHWDYERSPNLQDARVEAWFSKNEAALIVKSVDADAFGGAVIQFASDFALRLFPAGTRSEDWRLFRPRCGTPHFVVSGGVVESDE